MEAPGVSTVDQPPRKAENDTLRADVAGFSGIFSQGPIFAPVRTDDAAEQRRVFGGLRTLAAENGLTRPALGPLAMHGFHQNGGRSAVVIRLAGPGAASAKASIVDPATGTAVGLIATSPGRWAHKSVQLEIPLAITRRATIALGTFLSYAQAANQGLREGDIVRVRALSTGELALGRLVDAGGNGLRFHSAMPTPPGQLVVDVIAPDVDVNIRGLAALETHSASLRPESPRFIWRVLEHPQARSPWRRVVSGEVLTSRDWRGSTTQTTETPRAKLPIEWTAPSVELQLATMHQGHGASRYLASVISAQFATIAFPNTEFAVTSDDWPRPPEAPWPPTPAVSMENRLVAGLSGGSDDITKLDAAAFRQAIRQLALHPAPSVVAIPDLMVAESPVLPTCDRRPADDRLPDPPPAKTHPRCESGPPPGQDDESEPTAPPPEYPSSAYPRSELPTLNREQIKELQIDLVLSLIEYRDTKADRIALLDSPPGLKIADVVERSRSLETMVVAAAGGRFPQIASLGAQLFPWIKIVDPSSASPNILLPGSGHLAGVMARTAREGTPGSRFAALPIAGAIGTERSLSEEERSNLNDGHVNALHSVPGLSVQLMGARSLSRAAEPTRYLPAARIVAYLRRVLRELGYTLMFANNDHLLFVKIRFALEAVLGDLQAKNVLAGRTAAESYRVRCDETTTTQAERDEGIAVAEIQVAPAVPLEFIEVRIAFTRDGVSIDDFPREAA